MDELKICIIGAGHMGRHHVNGWRKVANAHIVAIADPDDGLAQTLAEQVGARPYTTYQDAITHPGVNVVSICTPTFLHPQITLFAVEQGKHVLCEKPIALTLEDAQQMLSAAQNANVHFWIGLMRRYSEMTPILQQWFSDRHLGRPVVAQTTNIMPLRPKRAMHDATANGGPLIDMIIHFVDIWSLLFQSEPVSVMAQGEILAANRAEIGHIQQKAIDTAAIIIRFASGDMGNIFVSWGMPPEGQIKLHEERCLGPNGQLIMRYRLDFQTAVWQQPDGSETILAESAQSMYEREIEAFAEEIRQGERRYDTAVAAINGLKLSLAALESIKTGQVVQLKRSG